MVDPTDRVEMLVAAPLGAAFVAYAAASALPLSTLARPAVSFWLSRWAMADVHRAAADRHSAVAAARRVAERHRDLATALCTDPSCSWFSMPLDIESQEWLKPGDGPAWSVAHDRFQASLAAEEPLVDAPPVTSTPMAGGSSLRYAVVDPVSDYDFSVPFHRVPVTIQSGARILEVDGPADWYQLCAEHPLRLDRQVSPAKESAPMTVDWRAAAAQVDVVHVTFFALLTTYGRLLNGRSGTAYPFGTDAEATYWLRDVSRSQGPPVLVSGPDAPPPDVHEWPPLHEDGRPE